jgi:hypothetical protein
LAIKPLITKEEGMLRKIMLLVILSVFMASTAVLAAEQKVPKRLIERKPQRSIQSTPAYRPVTGAPVQISAAEVERSKDFCDLAASPAYYITDWFHGLEWYANYQDPEEYGCTDVWPFQVTEICFQINTEAALFLNVQGVVFENAGAPDCPMPSDVIICETPPYEVDIPGAGYWDITLPISPEDTCCVNNPYFAAIYIANDLSGSGADPISSDTPLECHSYMYRGVDWEDLVFVHGWPGQMLLFSRGYTDPQNPCETPEGDCDTISYHGPASYYWQVPDAYGYDFFNERFDIPYDCILEEIRIYFYDVGSSGSPDAHIYVWESDGTYPLDPTPPAGALAEFVIPDSDIVWWPQPNVIETEIVQLELTGMQPIHVGYSHPRVDVMDTLSILSDDGSHSSTRSVGYYEYDGTWGTILDDWGIGVDFLIEIVVCPPKGCCWWWVDGGPETGCASPVTAAECADLGGNYIPGAECNVQTGRCDVPHAVIVEPNDTSIWDKNYFSDTLTIQVVDFPTGEDFPAESFFDVYVEVPVPEWIPIGSDTNGITYMQDPHDPLQPGGDGWQIRWHPGELPEGYYKIRATLVDSFGRSSSDTIVQYWDPYPPEVDIIFPGVFNFPAEGELDIQFYTPGDNITEMYVIVYPIPEYPGAGKEGAEKFDCIQGFNKGVPHFNQHNLYPNGSDGNNRGCSPTSMAACLKYWANNGFPCLNNNGAMSDADMVSEIAGFAKTHPDYGTDLKAKKAAIEAYIKKHCGECVFQPVEHLQGKDVTLQRLIKELFEEDEDVITGDEHHVTVVNSFCIHPKKFIDYMDPWTGTEVNGEFDVSKGFDGHPLLELVIVSPKEATQPVPTETVATTDQIEPVPEAPPGTYHYPWYPDPELFPVGTGYFVNVEITDILGHKGWDLVKVELFLRGDANGDGIWDLGDAVYLLNYLFKADIPPFPLDAGDANCNGEVNLGDPIHLLNYLFKGGDPPGCP